MEYKINDVNNKIDEFEIICKDFKEFSSKKNKNDIIKLSDICKELKIQSLNYFEKNFSKEYEYYSKFLEGAKKRNNSKKSKFFNEILKYNQKYLFKNNEEKALEETGKDFDKLSVIFEKGGVTKVDENILSICIISFYCDEKQLKNELKILSDIFKVKGNLDDTYEEIVSYSQKDFIFDTATAIDNFIEKIGPKKTNFQESIKEITSQINGNKEIDIIKKCYNKLKELNIIDIKEKENKLIKILLKLKEKPDSIEFLLKTSVEEADILHEISFLNEDNFININDILGMEKCIEFFNNIGTFKELKEMEDREIIEKMQKNVQRQKDIICDFDRFINNFEQINLLKTTADWKETFKYKIKTLFQGATFLLSNEKNNKENNKELLFICNYEKEIKNVMTKISLTREDIISLRNRALLTKITTADYQYFIDSLTEIINISDLLKELYIRGYPKIIKIKIYYKVEIIKKKENEIKEINPKIELYIDDESKYSFKDIIVELTNILEKLKENQINSYKTMPLTRYLYGRQFNLLYEALKEKKRNQIEYILKYITNDSVEGMINKFSLRNDGDIIQNNILDWNDYLNEVLIANNLTLEKIYQPTLIKPKKLSNNSGIFIYICEQPEKNLFQIYKYLTDNNPISQNILLCNRITSNEEITAFLYRAILCEYNSCFIINKPESLGKEQKIKIFELIDDLKLNLSKKIKSCLIFLFNSEDSDIYKNLQSTRYSQILQVNNDEIGKEKYEKNDIEVIKSDRTGVGKSTKIKVDIEKMKKKSIYFPFGGSFTRDNIICRLKNLQIDNKYVLHLDLYDSEKTNLMLEFLFSILITRFYGQNEDIFFLSKDIQIKVEIPNTFINFFKKFPVLDLFTVKELKISNLPPLIVPHDISCDIEIVANYLKALKEDKINGFDFIFPGITPVDFEKRVITDKRVKWNSKTTSLKPDLIPADECQKLIFEIIKDKIKEPNYYQITSFINVLAVQLKKLNRNMYLNAFDLICNGKWNILNIRTFLVKKFISLTSHFIEGAFSDILQSQEKESQSRFGLYEEKEDLNNAINNLAKDLKDVISFDKIDPSLVFFHEKYGELFSIITNKPKDDKEYQQMLQLKNSQFDYKEPGFEELPNYKKYEQLDFLQELQCILDVTTPVKKDPNSNKISLEEIAGDYVLTADNFVKMVLILLRIRSGIPVIMIGERGCGKTSLIRKLSEMKNDGDKTKMKILNIHAGTNDDDIIKFINENVIPEAKKISEGELRLKENYSKWGQIFEDTKLWVFLKEINTCKSMGLITELMCKHSCQGSPLPDNIIFIATCNPYRWKEKRYGTIEGKIGLNTNQTHPKLENSLEKEKEDIKIKKGKNLVYNVYPLPFSLLNFVFYFGDLKPEDERGYISRMIRKVIEKINKEEKIKEDCDKIIKIKEIANNMLWNAIQYIREKNDKSTVSFREITKFNIFYEYFYYYLNLKKDYYLKEKHNELNEDDKDFYEKLDVCTKQVYAINLSIFMACYLRISNEDQRKELNQKMNNILAQYNDDFKVKNFLDLPLKEQKFIIDNIKLDKDIVKDGALLENVFSLFININCKVPIFIFEKSGDSKSLSMQLIIKSMKGTASNNPFFKKLPKIIVHYYQCSLSSKSKEIKMIFDKSRETLSFLSEEDKKKNISLVFIDKMERAAISVNNPLKVINKEVECEQIKVEDQIAFVGLSKENLDDAPKMNKE